MKFTQNKTGLLLAILLCQSSLLVAAEDAQKPRGLPAEVIKVQAGPLTHELSAVGTLEAWESATIRPEQSGLIKAIVFEESQAVKKGDVLFELNADSYRAEVAQANARVRLSQNEYNRAEKLLARKVGSENDRDSTLAQLRVDEAQLEVAKTLLNKMTIKAPFDGVVGLRNVSPGDYVTAGQDLVQLSDITKIKVEFSLPETALSQIKKGQVVKLNIAAFPQEAFLGEIYAIAPSADPKSHSIKVKAKLENTNGQLRAGLFSTITIQLNTEDNALMIPEQAIIPNNKTFLVMRMDQQSTVSMVPVTLGIRRSGEVQIVSGISQDDVIVTAGHMKLRPGMPITPIFPKADTTASKQEG